MEKYKAFKYFCNLIIGNHYLTSIFSFKLSEVKKTEKQSPKIYFQLEAYFKTFDFFLKERHPLVLKHFEKYSVTSDVFLIEWSYSLFCRAFPLNTTA